MKDAQFYTGLMQRVLLNVSVMQMCRVVSYDAGTKRANVQPQALKSNYNKRALIQGALVLKHCEEDIAPGKSVAVVFCDRDLDNISSASDFTLSSKRLHSVNDAVVVGVWDV